MLHGGTLVSYISNEGGVAVCTERLENQRTAIRRLQVRDIAGQRIWNAARNLICRTKQINRFCQR